MNRNTKVPLGKKDKVLRIWWDNVSSETISQPICLAIAYYVKTGEFMNIGTVSAQGIENAEFDNIVKYVYIPINSIAYNYLEECQNSGQRVATVIKYILRNSIKKSDKNELYGIDKLRVQLESLAHKEEVRYVEISRPEHKDLTPSMESPIDSESLKHSEEKEETSRSYQDNNEDGGDLISALLGDAGFTL